MNTTLSIPHLQFKHHLPFPIQEIVRLDGEGNYTTFLLANGTRFLTSRSIGVYESAFKGLFVRVHKSCIINPDFLLQLNPFDRTVILTDGSEVPISRRRWNEIKMQLDA
jgi:DNA-binding LytR/AlgR family response regulator